MSAQQDIDAAVVRLIALRRNIMPTVGNDKASLEMLAAIQGAFHDLLLAKQHEEALENDPLGLEAFEAF